MKKICFKCKVEKELNDFHKKKKNKTQSYCKQCRKQMDQSFWNEKTPEERQEKMKRGKFLQEEKRKYLCNFLSKNPCIDCGESDPIVLEFDHQRDKKFDISYGCSRNFSLDKLKLEIEKCQIRCANCHRRKTAKDYNWYRFKIKEQPNN